VRSPKPLSGELSPEGFTAVDARNAGVARARLRAADLSAEFYGVRRVGEARSVEERAAAYAARMPRSGRFTHTTAAILHGLRLPEGFFETGLHVGVAIPHRAPRVAGVIGHQVAPDSKTVVRKRLVLSGPVEAWVQCATVLKPDDLIVMGDGLVRRQQPLASIHDLAAAVSGAVHRRGRVHLHHALDWIRPGTDSARETALRLMVVRAGFPEPEVNGEIINRHGARIARGDLVYRQQRVILEYDGRHHAEAGQFSVDIARLDELMEEEWRVIRVDKALMDRRAELLRKLETALTRRR
jgi:hypothetical protein